MATPADLTKIPANATKLTPASGAPAATFATLVCSSHAAHTPACAACRATASNTIDHMRRAGYTW